MSIPTCTLEINRLELPVHLGWLEEEQQAEQIVYLDVVFTFAQPPVACQTDHLKDTPCYDRLIDSLRNKIAAQKFRLIEKLACHIYQLIRAEWHIKADIWVRITKYPTINGLSGGVCFSYGDLKK